MSIEILRLRQVQDRIGLSRSYIYHQISIGEFPSPISLGPRAVGWIASEIDDWIEKRIVLSRGADLARRVEVQP